MRMLSTFSGVGGFERAFSGLADLVGYSEIDKGASAVMAHRFPGVTNYGDITKVNAEDLPPFDLMVGGFPCQDVSQAAIGRKGLEGARSGLWWEFVRLAAARQPRWLLVENVPGLLSSNGGRDMATVVGTMGELGYSVAWRVLDAQFFGVPQRRRRLFLVGHLGAGACAGAVLHEREGGAGDPPTRPATGQDIASASVGGLDPDRAQGIVTALTKSFGTGGADLAHAQAGWIFTVPYNKTVRSGARDAQGNLPPEVWDHQPVAPTLNRFDQGDTRAVTLLVEGWPDPAGTLTKRYSKGINTTVDDGAVVVEFDGIELRVRRLTPLECERLQGFDDEWTLVPVRTTKSGKQVMASNSARYGQMGNAVAVPVVRWIAQRLAAIDQWCQREAA